MTRTTFYKDTLGAKLRNHVQSWGSRNPVTNRIFLSVWADEIRRSGRSERIVILRKEPRTRSIGYIERRGHIELIRRGAPGFGVLCTAMNPSAPGQRRIKSFDQSILLHFGKISEDGGNLYAEIVDRVTVAELASSRNSATDLASDLKAITRAKVDATTREALIAARLGQGFFRAQVLQLWGSRCAVTGAATLDAIRASHIKPWRSSNNEERLDAHNGLPLVASLDALFDSGLISFDAKGDILISRFLPNDERRIFNLKGARLLKRPLRACSAYLAFHASNIFRDRD